jgi:autotransporter-associated beta strand protein
VAGVGGFGVRASGQTVYTFSAPTASLWGTPGNWTSATSLAPGSSSVTTNNDIGSFAGTGTATQIQFNFGTVGTPYYIGGIRLESTNTVARTFGSNAATAGVLVLNGTGTGNTILENLSAVAMTVAPTAGGTGALSLRLSQTNSTITTSTNGAIAVSAVIGQATGVTAGLTKTGAGTLTLSGTNTYTGGTTIAGGGLSIAGAGNIGSGALTYSAIGTSLSVTGTASTFANNFVVPNAAGRVTFVTPNNSATVINGTISGGIAPATPSTAGGTEFFFQGGGSGQNTGALTLNGNNTGWQGRINVQRGPLILGNANAAGSTAIWLDSNNPAAGALQLGGSFTIANAVHMVTAGTVQNIGVGGTLTAGISGPVSSASATTGFTKVGTGTLVLSGTNTYGPTTVSAGTLAIGAGGTAGTLGTGAVTNNATLAFNRSDSISVGNAISGTGTINHVGTGTTTLTGVSPFTGTINVSSGTLALGPAASIAAANTVVNGGLLDVSQQAAYAVADGRTLTVGRAGAPETDVVGNVTVGGGVGGTLGIGGVGAARTATFANDLNLAGGTLQYDLSNVTTVGAGVNDLLVVNGNMSLTAPTSVAINPTAGPLANGSYTLLTYAGTFTGDPANLSLSGVASGSTRQTFSFDIGSGTNSAISLVVGGAPANLTWVGTAANNVWDVAGATHWTGAAGPTPDNRFLNFDNVTFDASGVGGATAVLLPADVSPSTTAVTGTQDYTFEGSGKIVGTGSLNKSGTGRLTLLVDATHTGGTTISGGTLQIGNGGTLGSVAGDIVNNGTLILARSDTRTVNTVISGSGNVVIDGGAVTLAGNNSYAGSTTITGGATVSFSVDANLGQAPAAATPGNLVLNNGTLALANTFTLPSNRGMALGPVTGSGSGTISIAAGTLTYGGIITNNGGGTGSLTKTGAGTLALSGVSTYSGGTTISAGRITITTPTALGTGPVTIASGTGINLQFAGNTTSTITNDIVLPAVGGQSLAYTANPAAVALVRLTGVISGGAAGQQFNLTDTNVSGNHNGWLSLENANNTFAGNVLLNRGTVRFTSDGALGAAGNRYRIDTWNANGRLQFGADNIVLNASRTIELVTSGQQLPIDVQGFTGTVAGQITGPGALTKRGTGTLILTSSANDYAGTNAGARTTVLEGKLQVGSGGTSGALPDALVAVSAGATLAFNRSDEVTFAGPITGAGGLEKSGQGNLTLTGANTFTGATTVTAGTLSLTGSAVGTLLGSIDVAPTATLNPGGTLALAAGRTLSGRGTIAGALNVAAGTVAPGNSPGTLTVTGDLEMSTTSLLAYDFNGIPGSNLNDSIVLTGGQLTLDGTLNIADATGMTTGTYTLISGAGAIVDNGLVLGTTPEFFSATITQDGSAVYLNVTAVPEPSTVGAVAVASLGLLRRSRRRR